MTDDSIADDRTKAFERDEPHSISISGPEQFTRQGICEQTQLPDPDYDPGK